MMRRLYAVVLMLLALFLAERIVQDFTARADGPTATLNGDTNGDGKRDITDAISLLEWLFRGGPEPVALADGLTSEQEEILSYFHLEDGVDGAGGTVKTLVLSGVNLRIDNGRSPSTRNGLGNLIIGSNATDETVQTGSHNLVIGQGNSYSGSYGIVGGYKNTIKGDFASVLGGMFNSATGAGACVVGGVDNSATGLCALVAGGGGLMNEKGQLVENYGNTAFADYSAILGGVRNRTGDLDGGNRSMGAQSTVSGGYNNRATAVTASVSGGTDNTADRAAEVLGDSFSKPRFVDNGDGTVTDKLRGLMWQKATDPTVRDFSGAASYCGSLNLGGHKHWRMPTREELCSIVDETRTRPAIDPIFEGWSSAYWSSTVHLSYTGAPGWKAYAWMVNFDDGEVSVASTEGVFIYVRAVRDAP